MITLAWDVKQEDIYIFVITLVNKQNKITQRGFEKILSFSLMPKTCFEMVQDCIAIQLDSETWS